MFIFLWVLGLILLAVSPGLGVAVYVGLILWAIGEEVN